MYKNKKMLGIAVPILFMLTACGPSAEEAAMKTTTVWTPIPIPAATTTPIPYYLEVRIIDESGDAVARVMLLYPASGSEEPVQTDDQGTYLWSNLPREAEKIQTSVLANLDHAIQQNMERGKNEIQLTLVRDSY